MGGGGHAKVLADTIEEASKLEIVGFVTINEHETLYRYPRLGNDDSLPSVFASGVRSAVLAIGDNRGRKRSMDVLRRCGFKIVNVISPAAVVSKYATLGEGIAVLPGAIVNCDSRLGDGVVVNTNASIDHDSIVGPFAHIGPGVSVAGCVRIEEGVLLGAGSTVIPGIAIGSWTIIGAGGAVVSDLPPNVVAVGVPALFSKTNRTNK
jgi:sugar O-acyltransferase (sialic acid O-acetyltransferase NeuD family)